MKHELKLGEINRLKVEKRVDFGYYMDGGEMGRILLPLKEAPRGLRAGCELDVFLYLDQEERLVATTLRPKAMVGQCAFMQVAWVNQWGAFMDWGLMKDLFVPFGEQKRRMQRGEWHYVYVYIDDKTHRIVGTSKVERYVPHDLDRMIVTDFAHTLLLRLKDEGGALPFGDKSPAEAIYQTFGVSKKVFKQAVGALYKQRLIAVSPERIETMQNQSPNP